MSAGCARARGRDPAVYRLTSLIVRSFLGRSRCRWILESFEGMKHADDTITTRVSLITYFGIFLPFARRLVAVSRRWMI